MEFKGVKQTKLHEYYKSNYDLYKKYYFHKNNFSDVYS